MDSALNVKQEPTLKPRTAYYIAARDSKRTGEETHYILSRTFDEDDVVSRPITEYSMMLLLNSYHLFYSGSLEQEVRDLIESQGGGKI